MAARESVFDRLSNVKSCVPRDGRAGPLLHRPPGAHRAPRASFTGVYAERFKGNGRINSDTDLSIKCATARRRSGPVSR